MLRHSPNHGTLRLPNDDDEIMVFRPTLPINDSWKMETHARNALATDNEIQIFH